MLLGVNKVSEGFEEAVTSPEPEPSESFGPKRSCGFILGYPKTVKP